MKSTEVIRALKKKADKFQAKNLMRFFKTGKGQYGENDIFLGIKVPEQRKIAVKFKNLSSSEMEKLLKSKYHECRLTALLILVLKYKSEPELFIEKKKIFNFYLSNVKYVNNWDLVDLSAPNIVGQYLSDKSRNLLYKYAKSENLWKKRIAIVSTLAFIKKNDFKDILKISEILLPDKHDLIHKAVGWMLREVGKMNEQVLRKFLDEHKTKMPRTSIRYAIEHFPEKLRLEYLKK